MSVSNVRARFAASLFFAFSACAGCDRVVGADFGSWHGVGAETGAAATEPAPDGAVGPSDAAPPPARDAGVQDATSPQTLPDDAGKCASGRKLCGGACVSLDDPAFGCTETACDAACPKADHGTAVCKGGACSLACDSGFSACPGSPGVCTALGTYYRDVDDDGYGGTSMVQACSAPPGYVGLSGDCDDGEPDVHPHQTKEFTRPYIDANGAISFDYDCDGKEKHTGTSASCAVATCDPTHSVSCVPDGSPNGRPPGADLTCGIESRQCILTRFGTFEWVESGALRSCN